jgi:hypothetical protein
VTALPATRWFQLYFRLQFRHLNFGAILCLFTRGTEMKKSCENYVLSRSKSKTKAIPIRGLQGCEMLRIPHCIDLLLTDNMVVSPTHRPHFTPQKHYYSGRDWVNSRA